MASSEQKEHAIAFESMLLKYAGNDPSRVPGDAEWVSMYGVLVDFGTSSELRLFGNVHESVSEQVSFTDSVTIPVRSLRKISPSPAQFDAVGITTDELTDGCFFIRYLDQNKVSTERCFRALRQDTAHKWLRALKTLAKRDLASKPPPTQPFSSWQQRQPQQHHRATTNIARQRAGVPGGTNSTTGDSSDDSDTLSRSSAQSYRRRHRSGKSRNRHPGSHRRSRYPSSSNRRHRKHSRRNDTHRRSGHGGRRSKSDDARRGSSSGGPLERALRHGSRRDTHKSSVRRTLRKFKKFLKTAAGQRTVLREAVAIAKTELAEANRNPDDDSARLTKEHLMKAHKSVFQKAKADLMRSAGPRHGSQDEQYDDGGNDRRSRHDGRRRRRRHHDDESDATAQSSTAADDDGRHRGRGNFDRRKRGGGGVDGGGGGGGGGGRGRGRGGSDATNWWKKQPRQQGQRSDEGEVRVPVSYIEQLTSPSVPSAVKEQLGRSLRQRAGIARQPSSTARYVEGAVQSPRPLSNSPRFRPNATRESIHYGDRSNNLSVVDARKAALKRNTSLCYLVDDQELSQVASPLCVGYHTVATYNDSYFAAVRQSFGVDYDFLAADRFNLEPFLDEHPPEVAWSADRQFVIKLIGPAEHRRLVAAASMLPECFADGADSNTLIVPVFAHFRVRRSEREAGNSGGAPDLIAIATGRCLPSAAPDFMWNHNLFQLAPAHINPDSSSRSRGNGVDSQSTATSTPRSSIGGGNNNSPRSVRANAQKPKTAPAMGIFWGEIKAGAGSQHGGGRAGGRSPYGSVGSDGGRFSEAIHVQHNPSQTTFALTAAQRQRLLEVCTFLSLRILCAFCECVRARMLLAEHGCPSPTTRRHVPVPNFIVMPWFARRATRPLARSLARSCARGLMQRMSAVSN